MKETDVLPIGDAELKYFDDFSGPEDLIYEIVKPCACVENCDKSLNDVGKIINISKESAKI